MPGWAVRATSAAALALVAVTLVPARASADQALSTGEVVAINDITGMGLRTPADPRLNGDGFTGKVLGYAVGPQVSTPDGVVTAAAGDEVAVVALTINEEDAYWFVDLGATTASLVAGGATIPLAFPLSFTGLGGAWAVGVPKGAPLELDVTRNGNTSRFDLRAGKRVAPDPDALYRAVDHSYVSQTVNANESLSGTASDGTTLSYQLTVNEMDVSYFGPTGTPVLPPDQAYVIVSIDANQARDTVGPQYLADAPLASSQVSLRVDTTDYPGQVDQDHGLDGSNLIGRTYIWAVPAWVTHATMTITPGTVPFQHRNADLSMTPLTVAFTGSATFDMTVPVNQPGERPIGTTAPALAPTPALVPPAVTTPIAHHGGGGNALPFLLVALVLVVAAAAVLLARRQRALLTPLPVVHTQAQLLAGMTRPLPPPARALPAGTTVIDARAEPAGDVAASVTGTRLVVALLGPLHVEGLTGPIRRTAVRRLLVLLAIHIDEVLTVDQLRYLLATNDDAEPSTSTVHNYVHNLRAVLPEGALLSAGGATTSRLVSKSTGRSSTASPTSRRQPQANDVSAFGSRYSCFGASRWPTSFGPVPSSTLTGWSPPPRTPLATSPRWPSRVVSHARRTGRRPGACSHRRAPRRCGRPASQQPPAVRATGSSVPGTTHGASLATTPRSSSPRTETFGHRAESRSESRSGVDRTGCTARTVRPSSHQIPCTAQVASLPGVAPHMRDSAGGEHARWSGTLVQGICKATCGQISARLYRSRAVWRAR
jgi:hypothetical protein